MYFLQKRLITSFYLLSLCFNLQSMEKVFNNTKNFCKGEQVFEENSTPFLTRNIAFGLAEIAMHNASNFLKIKLVPRYFVKKEIRNGNQVYLFCVPWIESSIKILNSDHLKSLVSEEEWSNMNIFYFLFGQYDRHFGNQVIDKDGKLHLIDNEAVANTNQYVLGYSPDKNISCAWVAFIRKEVNVPNEPDNFYDVIKSKQDPAWINSEFPNVDVWTKRDIDNGYCRIWKNTLWRQLYAFNANITAPFSEIISSKLLEKIESLTPEILTSFWPELPFNASQEDKLRYDAIIQKFVQKTMERRSMVLDYFEKHPEGIRENI